MKHLGRSYLEKVLQENIILTFSKEIMLSSSSLSSEFFDMDKYGFCPATPFIPPSMIINVFDELLRSTNGNAIYVQCTNCMNLL